MKRLSLLALIASIWGCTEERFSSVLKYQISISEEVALDFSEVGMSSEVPFSISPLDNNNESFLVFNNFFRRLDTVFFSLENNRIVSGLEVSKEGPGGIPSFDIFSYNKYIGVIYMNGNSFFYNKDDYTVKLNMTNELDNGSSSIKSIYGADRRNGTFQISSDLGSYFSIIIHDNDTNVHSLMSYDFDSKNFHDLPFSFDDDQMMKQDIQFKNGSVTIRNTYAPYLTVFDSLLIISYPFFNKISVLNLEDNKQSDYLFESELFKTQKDLPVKTDNSDYEKFSEEFTKWNNDVHYASISRLNDKLIYRMVFENLGSSKVYLELFNNSFDKVGEFDLTALQPDLKWFHITVEGKILIQSSKDPDEDIFKYYLISVDEL
ncbi:hypothetical protein [Algoriphagus chordae]|uniref:TolB-like protein n=1 Tax=Algoriphagus chordae TaxID=237019 RepID=A0A2W7QTQ9_9BACT|nr:hypothetical protein [Algoriphagus chordae]PZX47097.1 hypothetical protein LV85_04055 [Algoriphagus chordae]